MPGYLKEEAYYMHYSVICTKHISNIFCCRTGNVRVLPQKCNGWLFEYLHNAIVFSTLTMWCTADNMCIFSHSNIYAFTHFHNIQTYIPKHQGISGYFISLFLSFYLVCYLVPSFDFVRVPLFTLCVCLKVPPLLCCMFPCLQFVFVCQFHPCCVSRPSCFSMFGPGWH